MTRWENREDETVNKTNIPTTGVFQEWNSVDWKMIREMVFRMQYRIAEAARDNRLSTLSVLQKSLADSLAARFLAVEEITKKPSGKRPGIDGVLWNDPKTKWDAASSLNENQNITSPLLRFHIHNDISGKSRALGIPTIHDRAIQKLYSYALQPVAETWGDPHSYGFRKFRSAKDAGETIRYYLCSLNQPAWVLDADIAHCFDSISHGWLEKNIPLDKGYLKRFLKSGYVEHGQYFPTEQGVPQGSIISPILANMTLDGLESLISRHSAGYSVANKGITSDDNQESLFVRYADDFIVMSPSKVFLEDVQQKISSFLQERGLRFSPEKTSIVPADNSFDFLHWRFQKKGDLISVIPSEFAEHTIEKKISALFQCKRWNTPTEMIRTLNPLLMGFSFHHQNVEAHALFRKIDAIVREYVWMFLQTVFPQSDYRWLKDTFWKEPTPGIWQFHVGDDQLHVLQTTPTPWVYKQLQTHKNPFLDREYFIQRYEQKNTCRYVPFLKNGVHYQMNVLSAGYI